MACLDTTRDYKSVSEKLMTAYFDASVDDDEFVLMEPSTTPAHLFVPISRSYYSPSDFPFSPSSTSPLRVPITPALRLISRPYGPAVAASVSPIDPCKKRRIGAPSSTPVFVAINSGQL